MGQKSECGLAVCLRLGVSPVVKTLSGAAFSSESSAERGSTTQLTRGAVGTFQFLTGGWTEGLSSSLAVCQRRPQFLSPGSLHWEAVHMAASSLRRSRGSKRVWAGRKTESFCNLNLEVASQKLMVTRSSPCLRGKDYTRAWGGTRRWR